MTNAILSPEPGPGRTCRVCGAALPADSSICKTCGAAYGESNRCPHCRAVTDVEPHPRLGFRCRACGGPRVPLDDPALQRSGRELKWLEKAKGADLRAGLFRAGGAALFASFGLSLMVTLFVLAVASPGLVGSIGALAASVVPLVLAGLVFRKGSAARTEAKEALDRAWQLVASDVVRQKGRELKAEELAKILRTDDARAELLLAELSVDDFVHARVEGTEAELGADRVRIALGDEAEAEPPEPEAQVPTVKKAPGSEP